MGADVCATELLCVAPDFVRRDEFIGLRAYLGRDDTGKSEDNGRKRARSVERLDFVESLGQFVVGDSALPKPLVRPGPKRAPDRLDFLKVRGLSAASAKPIEFRKDIERIRGG